MVATVRPPFRASILPDAYVARLRIRLFLLQLSPPGNDRDSKNNLDPRDARGSSKAREACSLFASSRSVNDRFGRTYAKLFECYRI